MKLLSNVLFLIALAALLVAIVTGANAGGSAPLARTWSAVSGCCDLSRLSK